MQRFAPTRVGGPPKDIAVMEPLFVQTIEIETIANDLCQVRRPARRCHPVRLGTWANTPFFGSDRMYKLRKQADAQTVEEDYCVCPASVMHAL
jgi:hypothetical protein